MSFCKSGRDVAQDNSQFIQDYPRKGYNKIDPLEKLQIINALDNGQCKADVAKKFGVHIPTISYIYKQKESILRKYTQKYNILEKHARCANLDHVLVEWLKHETKNGNVVTEDQLRDKAHECMKTTRDDCPSICTDDWLLDFRIRHNIAKYVSDIECNSQDKGEWQFFLQDLDVEDVYFGMTCALNYNFDFNKYVNDLNSNSYISVLMVTNGAGTDKRELAVVGKDLLTDMHLGSLPVNYYYSDCPQINYALMFNYLKKWDIELKIKNSTVSLLLDLPEKNLEQFQLENIKLINASKLNYALKVIEKIVQSFKYHYRKLQITRTVMHNKDAEQSTLLDYIYMINSAWYNVSSRYIKHLALPLSEGSLYFKANDGIDHDHTLSKWCEVHNIKLNPGVSPQTLDNFLSCDNKVQSTSLRQSQDTQLYTRELSFESNSQPTSGVDAYQAIKRLVSYLQGEGADKSVVQHARLLEDHLEYGALVEIHQIINSTNDEI